MTIAIDAGGGIFQFYREGVIGKNDGCGTGLNHAVVLVGYSDKDGGDDDSSPTPDPDPQPASDCTVFKWWHSCEQDDRRRLQKDSNGYHNYWKIQNSWGTGWGDNGFVLFEIAEGDGVCGMNGYVEYVEM